MADKERIVPNSEQGKNLPFEPGVRRRQAQPRDEVGARFADLPVREGPLREVRNIPPKKDDPKRPDADDEQRVDRRSDERFPRNDYFWDIVVPKLDRLRKDYDTSTDKAKIVQDLFSEVYDAEDLDIQQESLDYMNKWARDLNQDTFGELARREYNRLFEDNKKFFVDEARYKATIDARLAQLTSNRAKYTWLKFFNIHSPTDAPFVDQASMAGKLHFIDTNFNSRQPVDADFRFMRSLLVEGELSELRKVVRKDIRDNAEQLIKKSFINGTAVEFSRRATELLQHFSTLLYEDQPEFIETLISFRNTHAEAQSKWQKGPGHNARPEQFMKHKELWKMMDYVVYQGDDKQPTVLLGEYVARTIEVMEDPKRAKPTLAACVDETGLNHALLKNIVVRTIETIGIVPTLKPGEKTIKDDTDLDENGVPKEKPSPKAKLHESLVDGRGFIPGLVTATPEQFSQYGVPYFTFLREMPSKKRTLIVTDLNDNSQKDPAKKRKIIDVFGGKYGGNLLDFFGDNPAAFFRRPLEDKLTITKSGNETMGDYFYRLDKIKDLVGKVAEIMKSASSNNANKDFFAAMALLEATEKLGFLGDKEDVQTLFDPIYEESTRRVVTNVRNGTIEGGDITLAVLRLEQLGLGRIERNILHMLAGNDTRKAIAIMGKEDYIRFLVLKLAGVNRAQIEAKGITDQKLLDSQFPALTVLLEMNPELRKNPRAMEFLLHYAQMEPLFQPQSGDYILRRVTLPQYRGDDLQEYNAFVRTLESWTNRDGSMEQQDKTPEWHKKLPPGNRPDQIRRIVSTVILELMHYGPHGFKGARHVEAISKAATRILLPYHPYIVWGLHTLIARPANFLFEKRAPQIALAIENAKISDLLFFLRTPETEEKKKKSLEFQINHPKLAGIKQSLLNLGDTYLFRMPYIAGPINDPVKLLNDVHQVIGERSIGVSALQSDSRVEEVMDYVRRHLTIYKTLRDGQHRVPLTEAQLADVRMVIYTPGNDVEEITPGDGKHAYVVRIGGKLQETTNTSAPGVMNAKRLADGAFQLAIEAIPYGEEGHRSWKEVKDAIRDMKEGTQYITLDDLARRPEQIPMEMIDSVEGISVGSGVMEFPEPSMRPQFIFNDIRFFMLDKLSRNTKYFWAKIAERSLGKPEVLDRMRGSVRARRTAAIIYNREWHRYWDNSSDVADIVARMEMDNLLNGDEPNEILLGFGAVGKLTRGGIQTNDQYFGGQPGLESDVAATVGEPNQTMPDKAAYDKWMQSHRQEISSNVGDALASISPVAQTGIKRLLRAAGIEFRTLPFVGAGVYGGLQLGLYASAAIGLTGFAWFAGPALGIAAGYMYFADRRGDKSFLNFHNGVRKFVLTQHLLWNGGNLDGFGPAKAMADPKSHEHVDTNWNMRAEAVGAKDKNK